MSTRIEPLSAVKKDRVKDYLIKSGVASSATLIEWKYYDETFAGDRERGFVLVRGDEVAGFIGVIPIELSEHGQMRGSAWICDWNCAIPGMGGLLLHKALRSYQHLAGLGRGTQYSRPALSGFCDAEYTDAAEALIFPVRMARILKKLGRSAPWLSLEKWPMAPRIPWPVPRRTKLSHLATIEPGIPQSIGPLLNDRELPGCNPRHDLSYVQWQIERCPTLASWTCYIPHGSMPPAAAICWRQAASREQWRMYPIARSGATTELQTVLGTSVRRIRKEEGEAVSVVVSRRDEETTATLRSCRFFRSCDTMPLFIFVAKGAQRSTEEFGDLSFVCTDLAYRF